MGLFSFFHRPDINAGVESFKNTEGAMLIDVRTEEEYRECHIEGGVNLPLDELGNAAKIIKDKNTPLFVHCLSGARSARAVNVLRSMGYTNVTDIGGISSYRGKAVK